MTSARRTQSSLQHPAFRGVRLTETDAPAGLLLSVEAGWNQTEADWRFLLRHGIGLGFEAPDGTLVASATILPYQDRIAWIGMVLVSRHARRQRLATLLLEETLRLADERGWTAMLDATAEGRQVYLPLGFRDLRPITRWGAEQIEGPAGAPDDVWLIIGREAELQCHAEWDAGHFGASRTTFLQALHRAQPALAVHRCGPTQETCGFSLARFGRTALQIGPLVATTPALAVDLLRATLARATAPVIVDAIDGRPLFEDALRRAGFSPRRHFIRMMRGPGAEPGRPESIFAIAGPEFG